MKPLTADNPFPFPLMGALVGALVGLVVAHAAVLAWAWR